MSKSIEWQNQIGLVVYGETPAGDYCIHHDDNWYKVAYTPFEEHLDFDSDDLDVAKKVCQEHFDGMINRCTHE